MNIEVESCLLTVGIGSFVVYVDVLFELISHFPSSCISPLLPDVGQLLPGVLVWLGQNILQGGFKCQAFNVNITILAVRNGRFVNIQLLSTMYKRMECYYM